MLVGHLSIWAGGHFVQSLTSLTKFVPLLLVASLEWRTQLHVSTVLGLCAPTRVHIIHVHAPIHSRNIPSLTIYIKPNVCLGNTSTSQLFSKIWNCFKTGLALTCKAKIQQFSLQIIKLNLSSDYCCDTIDNCITAVVTSVTQWSHNYIIHLI